MSYHESYAALSYEFFVMAFSPETLSGSIDNESTFGPSLIRIRPKWTGFSSDTAQRLILGSEKQKRQSDSQTIRCLVRGYLTVTITMRNSCFWICQRIAIGCKQTLISITLRSLLSRPISQTLTGFKASHWSIQQPIRSFKRNQPYSSKIDQAIRGYNKDKIQKMKNSHLKLLSW